MFVLAELKDSVRVPPHLFDINPDEALRNCLNGKFANKVIHNTGLAINLWDITKVGDSFLFPGDGASHTLVHFRYVFFRPFVDEIIVGKVKSSSKEGLRVSLGFFDDIFVAVNCLPEPSIFDETEQLWAWQYEMEGETHKLYIDIGESIRFRVINLQFTDLTPDSPDTLPNAPAETPNTESASTADKPESEQPIAFSVLATVNEPGLGLLSWWTNN